MTDYARPTRGVTTPPRIVPPCAACSKPLGLYYADCATCGFYASEYTLAEYAAALGGDK